MELTYTLRNVLIGAVLVGSLGGVLGSFAFLRRQSLLGDGLAHAVLPGVCLAFLLSGRRDPALILIGALAAGIVGALAILGIARGTRIKMDSAIGMVLSVFFGVGIILLTIAQRAPTGQQAGLDTYLFGQAATIRAADLHVMGVVGALVLAAIVLFYKEFKLLSFDSDFGASLGLPMRTIEIVLTVLLATVVVLGLQMVGVVLIIAALVTPAAAARQWTDRLGTMLALAAAIGAGSGLAGGVLSTLTPRLPTGPTIVVFASVVLVGSLLLAPRRGIVWDRLQERRVAARIRRENVLRDLYLLGEREAGWEAPVPEPALMGMRGQGPRELARALRPLLRRGLVRAVRGGFRLTTKGLRDAERLVRKHRLWEVYLTRRLELPADHVHRDAEAMEHAISDAAVENLEAVLGFPTVDPHGRRIPPRRPA